MNKSAIILLALCLAMFPFVANVNAHEEAAGAKGYLSGRVATLGEIKGPTEINVGGLLIVNVKDSGSRPPQNIVIDSGTSFKRLGKVRGINVKNGQALMGGGYTWFLLSPQKPGEHEINVSYTNADNQPFKQTYKVEVTADDN